MRMSEPAAGGAAVVECHEVAPREHLKLSPLDLLPRATQAPHQVGDEDDDVLERGDDDEDAANGDSDDGRRSRCTIPRARVGRRGADGGKKTG